MKQENVLNPYLANKKTEYSIALLIEEKAETRNDMGWLGWAVWLGRLGRHARTHTQTHARTHALTHAPTHARAAWVNGRADLGWAGCVAWAGWAGWARWDGPGCLGWTAMLS